MSENIKNTISAPIEAGENLIVGDANKIGSKAKVYGNYNILLQDSMLMIQDSKSGETLDLISMKNIHNVIQNFSDKSNNCKTISIVVLCATYSLIGLSPNNATGYYFLILPIVLFWYLDAQYLSIERMYRQLSRKVIEELQQRERERERHNEEKSIDFDVSRIFKERYFRLNIFQTMNTQTLITFYGLQLVTIMIINFFH